MELQPTRSISSASSNRRFDQFYRDLADWVGIMNPTRQEAAHQIRMFLNHPQETTISFQSIPLNEFPEPILFESFAPHARRLRSLNLSHTGLDIIPVEISRLEQLTNFNLGFNRLTQAAFPQSMRDLHNLEYLSLRGNRLVEIPEAALSRSLSGLDLSENLLTSLPPSLAGLDNLETLRIDVENLPTLPNTLRSNQSLSVTLVPNLTLRSEGPSLESLIPEDPNDMSQRDLMFLALLGALLTTSHHFPNILFVAVTEPEVPQDSLEQLLEAWKERGGWNEIPEFNLDDDQSTHLKNFVARLQLTRDFQDESSHELLAQRLYRVLLGLKEADLKDDIINEMQDALGLCGDRVAQGLDEIEMKLDLHELSRSDGQPSIQEMHELGVSYHYLQFIDSLAKAKAAEKGMEQEELEFVLAYRTGLRDRISLPTHSSQMLFRNYTNITDGDLLDAHIACSELTQESHNEFLASWSPWQSMLCRLYPDEFEEVALGEYHTREEADQARDHFYKNQTKAAVETMQSQPKPTIIIP